MSKNANSAQIREALAETGLDVSLEDFRKEIIARHGDVGVAHSTFYNIKRELRELVEEQIEVERHTKRAKQPRPIVTSANELFPAQIPEEVQPVEVAQPSTQTIQSPQPLTSPSTTLTLEELPVLMATARQLLERFNGNHEALAKFLRML